MAASPFINLKLMPKHLSGVVNWLRAAFYRCFTWKCIFWNLSHAIQSSIRNTIVFLLPSGEQLPYKVSCCWRGENNHSYFYNKCLKFEIIPLRLLVHEAFRSLFLDSSFHLKLNFPFDFFFFFHPKTLLKPEFVFTALFKIDADDHLCFLCKLYRWVCSL